MIASVTGTLTDLQGETAYLDPGHGLVYELLLPAFAAHRLAVSIGQTVTLHTLHFLESNNQGATYLPRLAGFLSLNDRAFYELFVTCKGIGHKRALRAMVLPTNQLALAIADRDVKTLQTMPEVGKKTAETIAVTLRDKVERFIGTGSGTSGNAGATPGETPGGGAPTTSLQRGALEVLLQLGENRAQAVVWIDQALAQDDPPAEVDQLVAAVYRIKGGG
ncbi:MAG: Holliday junction branch migration protein RuvA [Phycisphaerales bacterium JB063]